MRTSHNGITTPQGLILMMVVHTPDYKDCSPFVNAINQNRKVTLYDLDCIYEGRDLIKSSMSTALIRGGNANEELERRLDDELNLLLKETSFEKDNDKASVVKSIVQNVDVHSANQQIPNTKQNKILDAELDRLLQTALESEVLEGKAFQRMLIDDEYDATFTKELKRLNKKALIIEEREKFKPKDEQLTKHLSDLAKYDLNDTNGINIKAVIDFVDIQFTTDRKYNRSDLKGALTKVSGHRYFVKQISDQTFSIRLHDIKNKKDLLKRLQSLSRFNKSANPLDLHVTCIERAIDFYIDDFDDEKLASFAVALMKSLRLPSGIHSARLYRAEGETFELNSNQYAPFKHNEFVYHLTQGYNIGINDERFDDLYHHIYIKKTDTVNGKLTNLTRDQWRVRCELRACGDSLLNESNEVVVVRDLNKALRRMSRVTKFVTLKGEAISYVRTAFDKFPRLWGKERSTEFNTKRHKQPQLKRSVVASRVINQVITNKQEDLARKFAR